MTDDPVRDAAKSAEAKRLALTATTKLIQRRMDPTLLASDLAKLALVRAGKRMSQVKVTPKQRKRALATAGVAAAAVVGLRVLYRNMLEKSAEAPSPPQESDVKALS